MTAAPGEEVTNTASLGPEVGGRSDNAVVSMQKEGDPGAGGNLADTGVGSAAPAALLAALLLIAAGSGSITASRRRRSE